MPFQIIIDALTVFYYVVVCLGGYHLIPTVIQWQRLNVVVISKCGYVGNNNSAVRSALVASDGIESDQVKKRKCCNSASVTNNNV